MTKVTFTDKSQSGAYDPSKFNAQDANELKNGINAVYGNAQAISITSGAFTVNPTENKFSVDSNAISQSEILDITLDATGVEIGNYHTIEILANGNGINFLPTNNLYTINVKGATGASASDNTISPVNGNRYLLTVQYIGNSKWQIFFSDYTLYTDLISAPVFNAGPSTANVGSTSLDVTATLNKNGTVYAVAIQDDGAKPTPTEVKNGQNSGGGSPASSGSASDTGSGVTITLTGLAANTGYDIYVVAEDAAQNNLQEDVTLVEETTDISLLYKLVSYYELDESSGDAIDSHSDNNGTVNGATQNGGNYTFDGNDDYVEFSGLITDLQGNNKGAISMWATPDNGSPSSEEALIAFAQSTGIAIYQITHRTDGKLRITFRTDSNNKWDIITDSFTFSSGVEKHILFNFNGSSSKIYIDGSEVSWSYNNENDPFWYWDDELSEVDNARLGSRNFNSTANEWNFDGNMRKVGFWNRNLAAQEISDLYNGGTPPTYPFS